MSQIRPYLFIVFTICSLVNAWSRNPDAPTKKSDPQIARVETRAEPCAQATSRIEMRINNVRATLLGGGDVWWDLKDGKYIVPNVDPASGIKEVSSIFAGAVWLGGFDDGGNLKMAAQTYRTSGNDFWPGPLEPNKGTTTKQTCKNWDRMFQVNGDDIRRHLRNYEESIKKGIPYNPELIPRAVKGWPSIGNPYFTDVWGFGLPPVTNGPLAGFYDNAGPDGTGADGIYDPADGDYPVIEIRGCDNAAFPDEMVFWIYNDEGAGGIHTNSRGEAIRMEVQVQAFSYATNDALNDMTFQRYKLINRAIEPIDSTYFAMWVDADLGCDLDDYVGCDTSRSLMFVYNEDAVDGQGGCNCPSGTNTYCENIPLLGVDYFRGPLNERGKEIGMSSFTYYNRQGAGNWPAAMTDPNTPNAYYNFISGSWADGRRFTYGGSGYNIGSRQNIKYSFTETPDNNKGWSMCTSSLPYGDRRTIQASGPFRLRPGAVNELIVGVPWVADVDYPCPNIEPLLAADDLAQALFNNCFKITDGPDAPDLDFIELDRELVAVMTNDTILSNNKYEKYAGLDLQAPPGLPTAQKSYRFEGYKVYQLANPEANTTEADLEDPNKARLIYQADNQNNITQLVNWLPTRVKGFPLVFQPQIKVQGANKGIQHTFRITEDQFATGDRRLVNHKKYYFTVKAYAFNDFKAFDPKEGTGQKKPYLEGRRNIKKYGPTPRPILDRTLATKYGNGPIVTRLDGVGVGGNFVDISDETTAKILNGTFDGKIVYKAGRGPINVKVYNPLDVKNGKFELTLIDENMGNNTLDKIVRWQLRNLDNNNKPILSETTLDKLNEQTIAEYGFSLSIGQTSDVGDNADTTNGAIGAEESYADTKKARWFSGIPDDSDFGLGGGIGGGFFNYLKTALGEPDYLRDSKQALGKIGNGYFVPYNLCDYRATNEAPTLTPAWINSSVGPSIHNPDSLKVVNNVNIIFTSDKSKWSRCPVIETAAPYYNNAQRATEGAKKQFELRASPAVTKDDANGDGKPDAQTNNDSTGLGWFPGYAIDVETGQRVNIFFGENSAITPTNLNELRNSGLEFTGRDMMFNPTSTIVPADLSAPVYQTLGFYALIAGGQHFVYVTNEKYDGCKAIYTDLKSGSLASKARVGRKIKWAGFPLTALNTKMLSYKDGLIPNDLTVKLRVQNPYDVRVATNVKKGYPTYQFSFDGVQAKALDDIAITTALDAINVVPNPYYGFSKYETTQFTTTIKVTNLPAECTVTIYSLDGRFIRQFKRNEVGTKPTERSNAPILQGQIAPALEWDLKNAKGIPVSSGVYLIHINAPGLGERVIKWFGVNRQFDPTGL